MSKPGDRIKARIAALNETAPTAARALMAAEFMSQGEQPMTDADFTEFQSTPECGIIVGQVVAAFGTGAIIEELDREAERRAAWEKRIESALNLPPETP